MAEPEAAPEKRGIAALIAPDGEGGGPPMPGEGEMEDAALSAAADDMFDAVKSDNREQFRGVVRDLVDMIQSRG